MKSLGLVFKDGFEIKNVENKYWKLIECDMVEIKVQK